MQLRWGIAKEMRYRNAHYWSPHLWDWVRGPSSTLATQVHQFSPYMHVKTYLFRALIIATRKPIL